MAIGFPPSLAAKDTESLMSISDAGSESGEKILRIVRKTLIIYSKLYLQIQLYSKIIPKHTIISKTKRLSD